MKEAIIAFLAALVIGAIINGFNGGGVSASSPPPEIGAQPGQTTVSMVIPDIADGSFDDEVMASKTPVLVDFYSESCAPCRQMAPVIEKLAAFYGPKLKVVKLDVDSNPSTTARFNVSSIPTFILFKGGERGESFTGVVPSAVLASAINKSFE